MHCLALPEDGIGKEVMPDGISKMEAAGSLMHGLCVGPS